MKITQANIDEVSERLSNLLVDSTCTIRIQDRNTKDFCIAFAPHYAEDGDGYIEALLLGLHFNHESFYVEEEADVEINENGVIFHDITFDGDPFTVEIKKCA